SGLVRLMVRGLNCGGQPGGFWGSVRKEGGGQGAADAVLKQDEQGGHLAALLGEPIRVAAALSFEEAVGSELAHVIAKLDEGIRVWCDAEGLEHGTVHLGRAPASELSSAMEQDLHQAEHPR